MLGLALSVGASGALVSVTEASAAGSSSTAPDSTKAFSSGSKVLAEHPVKTTEVEPANIVAYHTVESGESLWQIAQQHRVGLRDLKFANELPPETAIRVGQVLKVPGTAEAIEADSLLASVPETEIIEESEALLVYEEITPTASDFTKRELIAQTVEESAEAGQVSSLEISEPSTVEIADASSSTESEPVITALATTESFSSYQIQAGDTLASIASSLGTTTQEIINANGLTNPNVIITGTTLRVPNGDVQSIAIKAEPRSAMSSSGVSSTYERLSYLQSTATLSESPL